MNRPTHQTVKLAPGRHAHPGQGVCVMELASMLAGEPFSDRPRAVCPVIATVLRTYNDLVDDERRQQLYAFASASVGTRGTPAVTALRARICAQWLEQQANGRGARGTPASVRLSFLERDRDPAVVAARVAARSVVNGKPGAEEAARALIGRLIACGSEAGPAQEESRPATPEPCRR
jgi:hypothetical protein